MTLKTSINAKQIMFYSSSHKQWMKDAANTTVVLSVRARDIMHEASLVGMHATRYSRLSAVCNDWVYHVCC